MTHDQDVASNRTNRILQEIYKTIGESTGCWIVGVLGGLLAFWPEAAMHKPLFAVLGYFISVLAN